MTFGKQCDEATSWAILDLAADAGITLIDTADVYPLGGNFGSVGVTEQIVGRWLKRRRGRFLVATKGGLRAGRGERDHGGSRAHLLEAIDASLRRLGTDYVDLYQLHEPDSGTPIDETLEALDHIVSSGRARYIGCSNVLSYQLATALGRSELRGLAPFSSVQARYNVLFRQHERELFPYCAEAGVAVIAYNPLAGGLLTGKYDASRSPTSGRFAIGPSYRERYWHDREFAAVDDLRPLVEKSGIQMATMAMSWVLANDAVTCAIVGASEPEQLLPSIDALNHPLDLALKTQLDTLTAGFRLGDATR